MVLLLQGMVMPINTIVVQIPLLPPEREMKLHWDKHKDC